MVLAARDVSNVSLREARIRGVRLRNAVGVSCVANRRSRCAETMRVATPRATTPVLQALARSELLGFKNHGNLLD